MLIADLIHSCSNENVAQAAIASIGGDLAKQALLCAKKHNLTVGRLVSNIVRNFDLRSDASAKIALQDQILGHDQPILRGLKALLEAAIENDCTILNQDMDLSLIKAPCSWEQSTQLH